MEKVDTFASTLWMENAINDWIDTGTREAVSKEQQTEFANGRFASDQLYFYFDGS